MHPEAQAQLRWRGAEGLAEDVRCYGKWIRDEAERRIGHLYPKAKLDDGTLANGHRMDLGTHCHLPEPGLRRHDAARPARSGSERRKARNVTSTRSPTASESGSRSVGRMARRGRARSAGPARECLLCGAAVPLAYIRAEGKAGRMGAQLMAIAAEGPRTRYYLPPTEEHEQAADVPRPADVPDADLPSRSTEHLGRQVRHDATWPICSPTASSPLLPPSPTSSLKPATECLSTPATRSTQTLWLRTWPSESAESSQPTRPYAAGGQTRPRRV